MRLTLTLAWCLSLADGILTAILLGVGATEANPLMAALFNLNVVLAIVVKQALMLGVCCGIWRLRREWLATAAFLVYFAIVAFELGMVERG